MALQIRLEYVVLRCADLERSRAFYQALGLKLEAEQHGRGAPHYSTKIGEVVVELYPLGEKPSSGLRLGLHVRHLEITVAMLKAVGADIVRADLAASVPSAVIRDPDGHEVAIRERR